jgi:hypothetical protein
MLVTLFFLTSPPAQAQVHIEMVDPGVQDPGWVVKLNQRTEGAQEFFAFLGNGIAEQSFTLRHQSTQGSAAMYGPTGLQLGGGLDTFPFSKPQKNLVGKEENTQFSPVMPRLMVAWTERRGRVGWGIGMSLTPPVPVQGASALVAGLSGSTGLDLGERWRVGAELDVTVGRAGAPVAASTDQKESGELEANTDAARYDAVCAPQEYGCVDVLSLREGGLRLVGTWKASEVVQPYVKLGAETISNDFFVQVDVSTWRLQGVLPDLSLGANLLPTEHLHGLVGGTFAYLPDEIATYDRIPLLYRFDASVAYVF